MTAGVLPDRTQLDRWVPDRPLRLRHRNQRIDVLNSAALTACELLHGDVPVEVELDCGGRPTGPSRQRSNNGLKSTAASWRTSTCRWSPGSIRVEPRGGSA